MTALALLLLAAGHAVSASAAGTAGACVCACIQHNVPAPCTEQDCARHMCSVHGQGCGASAQGSAGGSIQELAAGALQQMHQANERARAQGAAASHQVQAASQRGMGAAAAGTAALDQELRRRQEEARRKAAERMRSPDWDEYRGREHGRRAVLEKAKGSKDEAWCKLHIPLPPSAPVHGTDEEDQERRRVYEERYGQWAKRCGGDPLPETAAPSAPSAAPPAVGRTEAHPGLPKDIGELGSVGGKGRTAAGTPAFSDGLQEEQAGEGRSGFDNGGPLRDLQAPAREIGTSGVAEARAAGAPMEEAKPTQDAMADPRDEPRRVEAKREAALPMPAQAQELFPDSEVRSLFKGSDAKAPTPRSRYVQDVLDRVPEKTRRQAQERFQVLEKKLAAREAEIVYQGRRRLDGIDEDKTVKPKERERLRGEVLQRVTADMERARKDLEREYLNDLFSD